MNRAATILLACLAYHVAFGADQVITNTEVGYSITYPATWTLSESVVKWNVQGTAPRGKDTPSAKVQLMITSHDKTTKVEYDRQYNFIGKGNSDQKIVSEEDAMLGGMKAKKLSLSIRNTDTCIVYLIVTENRVIKLWLYGIKDQEHADDVNAIVKSIKFLEMEKKQ